jgi:ABC-type antimicrobial peptide transport system permease subunit
VAVLVGLISAAGIAIVGLVMPLVRCLRMPIVQALRSA